jgi:HD-GYP domain-containing protein (c-di-GMP phosphodiesterase class II)
MISDRPYREALGREALDGLQKNMGEQFDPRVVLAIRLPSFAGFLRGRVLRSAIRRGHAAS